jgi:hypothetical protein
MTRAKAMKKLLLIVLACIAVSGCAGVNPYVPEKRDPNAPCIDNVPPSECGKPPVGD